MTVLLTALRAAAEPTRLRLLAFCAHDELTVSELVRILGQSQPRVSRHLKLLADAGLVERFSEGSWVFHRLAREGPAAAIARRLAAWASDEKETVALDKERLEDIKREREKAAADYFSANAERWYELRALTANEAEVEHAILDILPVEETDDLLDLGTGTGRMIELFAPRVRHAQGIDASRDMLAVARANLERAGLENCSVRQGDIYQLPYKKGSYDAVVIHQVLHYLDHPGRALAEAARILRPGGRLLIVDYAPHDREELRRDHEHRRLGFSNGEILGWLNAAGLVSGRTAHLPGDALTVSLWTAAAGND